MAFSLLQITDETTTIDLLSTGEGWLLADWTPAISTVKGGGAWQDSPLAAGRRPAIRFFSNISDAFPLKLAAASMDKAIWYTQELRRLLQKAVEYWTTDWQNTPVYIVARGACETNTRYSIIYDWSLPNDDNPYAQPLFSPSHAMDEMILGIEHGPWTDTPPGDGTCVEVFSQQRFYFPDDADFFPTQSSDDAFITSAGGINIPTANMDVGNTAGLTFEAGIRFRNVTIPQGTTIYGAWIRFIAQNSLATNTVNLRIYGEDADNPATFSTYANFIGRTRTTAFVNWGSVPGMTAGVAYYTPDIKSVVQEIVDRPGFVSGNSLVLFVPDNASSAGAYRQLASWDSAYTEPTLYILTEDNNITSYGSEATCADQVYVANKHNWAQLTNIYYYDASGPSYSANLLHAALPTTLLPATPAAGDIIYFGIQSPMPDTAPFSSLVFDIGTAQTGITSDLWEYWDGAAWSTLLTGVEETSDNTKAVFPGPSFSITGIRSIHWPQPDDWALTVINGVQAWWVRYRVVAAGGGATPPIQQNRYIYTVTNCYVELESDQVHGDLPANIRVKLNDVSSAEDDIAGYLEVVDRIIMATRSMERGINFLPYINLYYENVLQGFVVTPVTGGFVVDPTTPYGYSYQYTPAGITSWQNLIYMTLSSSRALEYRGTFRMFLRVRIPDSAYNNDWTLRMTVGWAVSTPFNYWTSEHVSITHTDNYISVPNGWGLFDFGIVKIPSDSIPNTETLNQMVISIYGTNSNVAPGTLSIQDIILMPCDEFIYDSIAPNSGYSFGGFPGSGGYLSFDSVSFPKREKYVPIHTSSNKICGLWTIKSTFPFAVQHDKKQRLYFLFAQQLTNRGSRNWTSAKVSVIKQQNYFSMRGSR